MATILDQALKFRNELDEDDITMIEYVDEEYNSDEDYIILEDNIVSDLIITDEEE